MYTCTYRTILYTRVHTHIIVRINAQHYKVRHLLFRAITRLVGKLVEEYLGCTGCYVSSVFYGMCYIELLFSFHP